MTVSAAPILQPEPRRRAGRPTAERAAEIDGTIREAARRLFLDAGFDATTMDAVAAEAGVSKGTLYTRFEGKDALLQAVIEDALARLRRRSSATDDLLPAKLGPRLREYARKLVETFEWAEYAQVTRLILAASQSDPDIGRRWLDAISAGYLGLIAREMEKAAGNAARPGTDWEALASLFTYGITGWHRNAMMTGAFSAARFEAFCATVAETIVAAATDPARSAT